MGLRDKARDSTSTDGNERLQSPNPGDKHKLRPKDAAAAGVLWDRPFPWWPVPHFGNAPSTPTQHTACTCTEPPSLLVAR